MYDTISSCALISRTSSYAPPPPPPPPRLYPDYTQDNTQDITQAIPRTLPRLYPVEIQENQDNPNPEKTVVTMRVQRKIPRTTTIQFSR